jgi:hypothetical protein
VLRGSFADHSGLFERENPRHRVLVLLNLLGQSVPVELPSADIAAIDG